MGLKIVHIFNLIAYIWLIRVISVAAKEPDIMLLLIVVTISIAVCSYISGERSERGR